MLIVAVRSVDWVRGFVNGINSGSTVVLMVLGGLSVVLVVAV